MQSAQPPTDSSAPEAKIRPPFWKLPAVQALLIQCISLVALFALLWMAQISTGLRVSLLAALLLQGVLAASLSFLRRLARWWLAIQFAFPLALLAAYQLSLPSAVYLVAFLLLLAVYWTVFRTRVPLYLSGKETWESVCSLLPEHGAFHFVDIGSGLGGLLLHLEKKYPNASLTGIELAPMPWLIGRLRALLARSRVRFLYGDYDLIDLSQFDVAFAYLSPAVMNVLWQKAVTEMRAGTLFLSFEFPVPDVKPDIVVQLEQHSSILYGWWMPGISHI